ncbi:MAG: rhomboid family intramembrane serine protease [Roseivirga sp.]|nr:rhomboid family intramembrane serine protease [Roseivirga sp.]
MYAIGFLGLIIIIANGIASYRAFKDYEFYQGCTFRVDRILGAKEYKRLITSGFVHISWMHLIFNMVSLYAFSGTLEEHIGGVSFLLIYFGSLLGGNLFSLYIHRNHGNYSAVGASGAVSGVIFAAIALFPGMNLSLILLPIPIPSWVFAILFVAISIRGIRSQRDNIGHDAHLGGGLVGLLIAVMLNPQSLITNPVPIALVAIPSVIFIYLIVKRPEILILGSSLKKPRYLSKDDRYNSEKKAKQEEVDSILDKISEKGFDSLTKKEKDILDKYSGRNNL